MSTTADPFIASMEHELTAGKAAFYGSARKGDRAAAVRADRRMRAAMDLLDSLYGPAGWDCEHSGADARIIIFR